MIWSFVLFLAGAQALAAGPCNQRWELALTRGEKIVFCSFEKKILTRDCAQQGRLCPLLVQLEARISELKKTPGGAVGTLGAHACETLGWTFLMGRMPDGSQVGLCQHPGGEIILCSSLADLVVAGRAR